MSLTLWGGAVAICLLLKLLVRGPSVLQLVMGIIVFTCIGLICARSPVLCKSDRDLCLRLFHGREMRALRFLGVLNAGAGAHGTR